MRAIKNWLMAQATRWLDWVFRKRNIGLGIGIACCAVLKTIASGSITIQASGIAGVVDLFTFSTQGGLTDYLQTVVVYLMSFGFLVGLGLCVHAYAQEHKQAKLHRVVVAELRGLVDTSDHPLIKSVPKHLKGSPQDALVDVRKYLVGDHPNVPEALLELNHLQREVRRARGDSARSHVQVVVGGIMPVPLLFYTGVLLDDEGHIVLMDWERASKRWMQLLEPDDGTRFLTTGMPESAIHREVVLAVSVSYLVDQADIDESFPGLTVIHLKRQSPTVNSLWSEETQAHLTQQFLQLLGALTNQGVTMVHLVLAAPASLSIRFGMAYDVRNMPSLRCYQWNHGQKPPHQWSVEMPSAPQGAAVYILTPSPSLVTG